MLLLVSGLRQEALPLLRLRLLFRLLLRLLLVLLVVLPLLALVPLLLLRSVLLMREPSEEVPRDAIGAVFAVCWMSVTWLSLRRHESH
jgi:hypothetical protein